VSRRTNQWKTENDIPTLKWPPQSPDLNIIENVWKVIKTKVQRRIDDIRNAEDLKTVVAEIWAKWPTSFQRLCSKQRKNSFSY
jgi:transposase